MKDRNNMTPIAAKAAGYRALTVAYQLPREQAMLDNVRADLKRGNIAHVLVEIKGGVSVWRSNGFRDLVAAAFKKSEGERNYEALCA